MTEQEVSQGRLSRRAESIQPFLVMEVFERAVQLEREGRSVIHLELGEPDWDTPAAVIEAGVEALGQGRTRYTHSLGHLELREQISAWYERRYSVRVSPERVIVTVGSSGAMLLVFAALLDSGDEVVMADPYYSCYPKFVSLFDGVPALVPVHESQGFQLDPERVTERIGSRTKALILNSPANPTGAVTSPERLSELVDTARGRMVIVSDEIYHGLEYGPKARSILEYDGDAIVVSGFSKLFAMTGWRLGYAILPEYLIRPVQRLQQNLFISPPDFAQHAAISALTKTDQEIEGRRKSYDERRRLVIELLDGMDLRLAVEPAGAFYVFVSIAKYETSSVRFCRRLLEETGVAVTPGVDFGPGGEGYIRISYANSSERIEVGMKRIKDFLREVN